ncbi:VPLPA-CTERM sorting domain-containing protein [Pikeienuella piscinae]|uniref:VPLPA-CTERM sorting domain-containing protein n=1 Tax=Pikeienuella piscinae TaxID=2748098 RepID=A0A7L5BSK5_9RHOB|nr:VPLPA-CTERM sorting domain-containing protein [Pikeienuella piscinae]QIE54075.1 VPLPA-CTERM sorting domain-containing protein [Pikeienuella piscinae]
MNVNIKHLLAGVVTAAAMVGSAHAATFSIDIYNFDANGIEADAAATAANVGAQTLLETVSYSGPLDFSVDAANGLSTIGDFFASGSGSVSGLSAGVAGLTLSSGAGSSSAVFRTTTFLDITANFASGFYGDIMHDDGISLFDDGILVTAASAQPPTTQITTAYSFDGGAFRLIYAAANGDPSVLNVSQVPLPATALLLVGAIGGLGFVSRRRRAAAA